MNPTDTTRALVEKLEFSVRDLCYEEDRRTQRPANLKACKTEVDDARAALLAHVAGVEALLVEANGLLRSCHDVFERERDNMDSTYWPALRAKLDSTLKRQHAHMHPPATGTTRPTEARDDG